MNTRSNVFRTFHQSFKCQQGGLNPTGFQFPRELGHIRRALSNAQVSTALRPFYFLVHPDLFGRWPQEQAVNEASLKQLKSYLKSVFSSVTSI